MQAEPTSTRQLRGPIACATTTVALVAGLALDVFQHARGHNHDETLFDPRNVSHAIIGLSMLALVGVVAMTFVDALGAKGRKAIVAVSLSVAGVAMIGTALATVENTGSAIAASTAAPHTDQDGQRHDQSNATTPPDDHEHDRVPTSSTTAPPAPATTASPTTSTSPSPTGTSKRAKTNQAKARTSIMKSVQVKSSLISPSRRSSCIRSD